MVVSVSRLGISPGESIHNIKLLAGRRWWRTIPKNAGIASGIASEKHGFIKVSCEDFPLSGMNLKWSNDFLEKLIQRAIVRAMKSHDTILIHDIIQNVGTLLSSVQLDARHTDTKLLAITTLHQPMIKRFPKFWFPDGA